MRNYLISMKQAYINDISSIQIYDSRGIPTIETKVSLNNGIYGISRVPSGASKGRNEALELRDGGPSLTGLRVTKAINNINTTISKSLYGISSTEQNEIDNILISLDGTPNKSNLGANAILSVSMAVAKASSKLMSKNLYSYISENIYKQHYEYINLPVPLINIINGGMHTNNLLKFQEFMIIPCGVNTFHDAIFKSAEVFHSLKKIMIKNNLPTSVGDEGGFAPNISRPEEAMNLILEAIELSGYTPNDDFYLAIDVAASEFYKDGYYYPFDDNTPMSSKDLVNYYDEITKKYPIVSIEDGMAEDDIDGWKFVTKKLGHKCQLVGDDLFVTNANLFKSGIQNNLANSILIKLNQVGTLSETIEAINISKEKGYSAIISHRSGETEDTFIADLAVAMQCGQIKTGSICRSDRVAKYNRLIRIESDLQISKKSKFNPNIYLNTNF